MLNFICNKLIKIFKYQVDSLLEKNIDIYKYCVILKDKNE